MPKKLDLANQTINNIKFISFSHVHKKQRIWNCVCYCGNSFKCIPSHVKNKNTKSCGCLSRSITIKRNKENRKWATTDKHSHAVWSAMHSRCYNKNNWRYPLYGGRGIIVCEAWKSFDNYYSYIKETLGEKPDKSYSIDRINNNGNYEPGNIRWASKTAQAKNKRGPKLDIEKAKEIKESNLSRKELATKYNVNQSQISRIINNKRWVE